MLLLLAVAALFVNLLSILTSLSLSFSLPLYFSLFLFPWRLLLPVELSSSCDHYRPAAAHLSLSVSLSQSLSISLYLPKLPNTSCSLLAHCSILFLFRAIAGRDFYGILGVPRGFPLCHLSLGDCQLPFPFRCVGQGHQEGLQKSSCPIPSRQEP